MERKDLTVIFDRYQFFTDPSANKEYDIELDEDEVFDPTNGKKSSTSTARHYKHWQRWQLANTLCSIYGATKGYQLLREVCSSKTSDRELMGDIKTANTYKKPVSTWAITELDSSDYDACFSEYIDITDAYAEFVDLRYKIKAGQDRT